MGKRRESGKVAIPESDTDVDTDSAVVRKEKRKKSKLHPSFLETHSYLRNSLKHLDEIDRNLREMRGGKVRDEEDVVIRRSITPKRDSVSSRELTDSKEYKKRRIKNKAINKVKQDLRRKGYSNQFLWDHHEVIEKKVEEFLSK